MWQQYAKARNLPFQADGVAEVALESPHIRTLEKYYNWGLRNGLSESDMHVYDMTFYRKFRLGPELGCWILYIIGIRYWQLILE